MARRDEFRQLRPRADYYRRAGRHHLASPERHGDWVVNWLATIEEGHMGFTSIELHTALRGAFPLGEWVSAGLWLHRNGTQICEDHTERRY